MTIPTDLTTTPSGLQYKDLEPGTGKTAVAKRRVRVHYTGTFVDGEQFDSSRDRGEPLEFTLVDRGGRISATNLRIEGEPMPIERAERAPQRQLTGEKASGTVKFFNAMKGFGFIQRDDGQPDAFVHISAVERAGIPTLNEGDRLEFELEVDRRGKYAAVNLHPIS